jgi:signal recognition particle subunit SRP54
MQEKMAKGSFGFDDFLQQMQAVKKMGGMKDLLKMMPGGGGLGDMDFDENELKRMEGIVHSMTLVERQDPDVIDASRRRRIAAGSGVQPHDVSGLVKTFLRSRDMLKAMSGGKLAGLKALLSGGLNMDTLSSAMGSGRKLKQRSRRKRVIVRRGKKIRR